MSFDPEILPQTKLEKIKENPKRRKVAGAQPIEEPKPVQGKDSTEQWQPNMHLKDQLPVLVAELEEQHKWQCFC